MPDKNKAQGFIRNIWYKLRYGRSYDDFLKLGEELEEANRRREIALSRIEKQSRIEENNLMKWRGKKALEAIMEYYPDFK